MFVKFEGLKGPVFVNPATVDLAYQGSAGTNIACNGQAVLVKQAADEVIKAIEAASPKAAKATK